MTTTVAKEVDIEQIEKSEMDNFKIALGKVATRSQFIQLLEEKARTMKSDLEFDYELHSFS